MLFINRIVLLCLCGALLSGCASSGVRSLNTAKAHHDFALALATIQKNYVDEVPATVLVNDAIESMYLFTGVAPLSDAELLRHSPSGASGVVDENDPLIRFDRAYGYLREHRVNPPASPTASSRHDKKTIDTDQVDIGLRLAKSGEWIRIAAVIIGSAAEAAGLNRGDAIIAINGRSTEGMSLSWCYQQLRGAVGTVVEVTVNSEAGDIVDYRIIRTKVSTPYIVMLLQP